MHQRQPDIVEPFQKVFPAERIDAERISQALLVGNDLLFEVNGDAVALARLRALEKFVDLSVRQDDRQEPVLEAVVVEDIRVAWCQDCAEAVIKNCPWCVLTARATAEIRLCQKNAGALK